MIGFGRPLVSAPDLPGRIEKGWDCTAHQAIFLFYVIN